MKLIIPVRNLHRYIIINIFISFISNTPRIFINQFMGEACTVGQWTWKICLIIYKNLRATATRHSTSIKKSHRTEPLTDWQMDRQTGRQTARTDGSRLWLRLQLPLCPVETFINELEMATVCSLPPSPATDSLLKNVKIVKNSIRICCERK